MKNNNEKNKAWGIDSQGNLRYAKRGTPIGGMYVPNTLWDFTAAAYVVMAICCVMDFSVFFQLFNSFLHDKPYMQIIAVGACLVAFDVLPSLLARELKKDKVGLPSSMLVKIISIGSFSVIFLFNLWLRLATKDTLLPADFSAVGSIYGGTEMAAINPAALPYCVFSCMMPVATSVFSFIVSYNGCHPLAKPLKLAYQMKCNIEDSIDTNKAILAEYYTDTTYGEQLTEEDNRLYEEKMIDIEEKGYYFADYVREQFCEHLGDAAATNYLAKNTHFLMHRHLESIPMLYEMPKNTDTDNEQFSKEAI